MGTRQPYRGNPEVKQYIETSNFIGGLNTVAADDVVTDIEFRELLNIDLGDQGVLKNRKGFAYLTVLNGMMENAVDELGDPTSFPSGTIRLAKVAKDEANILKYIADYDDLDAFRLYVQPLAYEFVLIYLIDSSFYRLKISKLATVLQETVELSKQYTISTSDVALTYTTTDKTHIVGGTVTETITPPAAITGYELSAVTLQAIDYQNYYSGTDSGALTVTVDIGGTPTVIINETEDLTNTYEAFVPYPTLAEIGYDLTPLLSGGSVDIDFAETYVNTGTFRLVIDYVYVESTVTVEARDLGAHESKLSIPNVEYLDDIYILPNDGNIYVYDILNDGFSKLGAYHPTPYDVKYVGFNVLADSPITYVDDQGITTKAISGVYLTYEYDRPALVLPSGGQFQINVLHTGGILTTDLDVKFYRVESDGTETLIDKAVALYTETISDVGGVFVCDYSFASLFGLDEIKVVISDVADPDTFDSYTAYYTVGSVTTDPVEKLDLTGFKILEAQNRLIYYGGKVIWFSDIYNFSYVPNYNYVTLPLGTTDEIVKIVYFRGSYIIFTKDEIYKMSGTILGSDFIVSSVNKFIGCLAPNTVRNVGNELIFLSRDGLYKLKSSVFQDNLENVDKIDTYIAPDIVAVSNADAILYDEQYILYYNDGEPYDAYRYYYNIQLGKGRSPYTRDIFAQSPEIIMKEAGYLFAMNGGEWYRYDSGHTDFMPPTETDDTNYTYDARIKTVGLPLYYPTHQKKFKNLYIKALHGEKVVPLYVTIKVDGYEVLTPYNYTVGRGTSGLIEYIETRDPNVTLLSSAFLGELELGLTPLGEITQGVHKLSFSGKGKNIEVLIEQKTNSSFGIEVIGYVFKLGKVKE